MALPACIVCVDAASVVAPGGGALAAVAAAVAGGATAVLLADTGATGAAALTHRKIPKPRGKQGVWWPAVRPPCCWPTRAPPARQHSFTLDHTLDPVTPGKPDTW